MKPLNLVVLLSIFTTFVLCKEDANKPKLLISGLDLNQGGYLLDQQPHNNGANAEYLNFKQHPGQATASSGLKFFNGGYSSLNLQPTNNGASYAGAFNNAYSDLSETDLDSVLSKAVNNYNQQEAGTGPVSQTQGFATGASDSYIPIQNLKAHDLNFEAVSSGSKLFQPHSNENGNSQISSLQIPNYQFQDASFVHKDVPKRNHVYIPQSVSLDEFQHQFNQQQAALAFAGVNNIQHQQDPITESQKNNVHLIPSSQQTQFASQSGFQPIHIEDMHHNKNFGENTDLKPLFDAGFRQYGSNQYGYGAGVSLGNGLKTVDYVSNGYQFKTPMSNAIHFSTTKTPEFKSDPYQATHKLTDFSGFSKFKATEIAPKSINDALFSLNDAAHVPYHQVAAQNGFNFNKNIPHQFQSDNVAPNSYKSNHFEGKNNNDVGGGYGLKPSNLELEASKSLQQRFKIEKPISVKSKNVVSYLYKPISNGHNINGVKSYIPNEYKYNDLKPYVSKVYTPNNIYQPKQISDSGIFEYGKPQIDSHQFGNNHMFYKSYEGNNQITKTGFEGNKKSFESDNHNINKDFGGVPQNTYKIHKNNIKHIYKSSQGKGTADFSLNVDKHGSGMISYVKVNNGNHGYTYSMRHP